MEERAPVIAIVDDKPQMRKALRRLLATHGFAARDYGSGADFLGALPEYSILCLVLDLHMPGLSGFDVLDILQSRRNEFPKIVLTGHDDAGTEERTQALGASAYLRKPVDEEILLSAIQCALTKAGKMFR